MKTVSIDELKRSLSSLVDEAATGALVHLSRAVRLTTAELQIALDRLGRDLGHFAVRDLTLDLPTCPARCGSGGRR